MDDLTLFDVVDDLCIPLAHRLWQVYRGDEAGPSLIFADNRRGQRRVSEQESRVLMCGLLEEQSRFYSIETPTVETYQQSGTYALSARADVTVHGSRSSADRVLNLEFKAGIPGVEVFRKDLEKLAREGIPGLWFHTLERANRRSVTTLARNFRDAWALTVDHGALAAHDVFFAICGLQPEVLFTRRLTLGVHTSANVESAFVGALDEWTRSGTGAADWLSQPSTEARAPLPGTPKRTGTEKWLIFCPDLATDTLLHFSRKGQSYRLRDFRDLMPSGEARAFNAPDPSRGGQMVDADEFLAAYAPEFVLDIRDERMPVTEVARWRDMIAHAELGRRVD